MGLSVTVGCSVNAGEDLAATTFANDLGGEDEHNNANGGACEILLWFRVLRELRQKSTFVASVNTRGQNPPFFASPQYASVLESRQNIKNNRGQNPLLH